MQTNKLQVLGKQHQNPFSQFLAGGGYWGKAGKGKSRSDNQKEPFCQAS